MGRRITKNAVRLDDGTTWHFDRAEGDEHTLEWLLRYGRPEDVIKHRLLIASIVGSYTALLCRTQKQRNAIVAELWRTLDATASPSTETEKT